MPSWADRQMSTRQAMSSMIQGLSDIPGIRGFPFMRSGLQRGGGGQPVQFVLGGSTYEELAQWRDLILARAAQNPGLTRLQTLSLIHI